MNNTVLSRIVVGPPVPLVRQFGPAPIGGGFNGGPSTAPLDNLNLVMKYCQQPRLLSVLYSRLGPQGLGVWGLPHRVRRTQQAPQGAPAACGVYVRYSE